MESPDCDKEPTKEEGELSDDCEIIDEVPPKLSTKVPKQGSQKLPKQDPPNTTRDVKSHTYSRPRRYDRPKTAARSKRDGRNSSYSRNRGNSKDWTESYRYHSSNLHLRDTKDTPQSRSGFWDRTRAAGHYLRLRGLSLFESRESASSTANNQPAPPGPGEPHSPTLDDAITLCDYEGNTQEIQEIVGSTQEENEGRNETDKIPSLPKPVRAPPSPPTDIQESDYIDLLLEYKQIQNQLELLRKEEASRSQPETTLSPQTSRLQPEAAPQQATPTLPEGPLTQKATSTQPEGPLAHKATSTPQEGTQPEGSSTQEAPPTQQEATSGSLPDTTVPQDTTPSQDGSLPQQKASLPQQEACLHRADASPSQQEASDPQKDASPSQVVLHSPQDPLSVAASSLERSADSRSLSSVERPPRDAVVAGGSRQSMALEVPPGDDDEDLDVLELRLAALGSLAQKSSQRALALKMTMAPLPLSAPSQTLKAQPIRSVDTAHGGRNRAESALKSPSQTATRSDGQKDSRETSSAKTTVRRSPQTSRRDRLSVSQKRPPPHTRITSPRKRLRSGSHSRRDERRRPDRSRRPNQDKSESEETRRREIHRILALDDHEEQVERFVRMLSSKLPSSGATPAAVGNKPSPQDNYEEVEMDIDSDPASPVTGIETGLDEFHSILPSYDTPLDIDMRGGVPCVPPVFGLMGSELPHHIPGLDVPPFLPGYNPARWQPDPTLLPQQDITAFNVFPRLSPPRGYENFLPSFREAQRPPGICEFDRLPPPPPPPPLPPPLPEDSAPLPPSEEMDPPGGMEDEDETDLLRKQLLQDLIQRRRDQLEDRLLSTPSPPPWSPGENDQLGGATQSPVHSTVHESPPPADIMVPPPLLDGLAAANWVGQEGTVPGPAMEPDFPNQPQLPGAQQTAPSPQPWQASPDSRPDRPETASDKLRDITMAAAVINIEPLPLEQQLPLHKPVVISLGASSGSDTEAEEDTAAAEAPQLKFGGALDQFLKAQRQTVEDKQMSPVQGDLSSTVETSQKSTALSDSQTDFLQARLKALESQWNKTKLGIERHQLQVKSLKSAAAKRQSTLSVVEQRVQQLRGQLAAAERMELATAQQVEHFNGQVERVQASMLEKQRRLSVLEQQARAAGKQLYGEQYVFTHHLPRKRHTQVPASDIHNAKQQLKERERRIADKIRELKERMQQPSGKVKGRDAKAKLNKKVSWRKPRSRKQSLEKISLNVGANDEHEVTVLTPHRRRSLADLSPSTRPNLLLTTAVSGQRSVQEVDSDLPMDEPPHRPSIESRLGPIPYECVQEGAQPSPQGAWDSPAGSSQVSSEGEEDNLVVNNSPRSMRIQCSGKLMTPKEAQRLLTFRSREMAGGGDPSVRQVKVIVDNEYDSDPASRSRASTPDLTRSPLNKVKNSSRSRSLTPDHLLTKPHPDTTDHGHAAEPTDFLMPEGAQLDTLRKSLMQSKVPASARHPDLAVQYTSSWTNQQAKLLPEADLGPILDRSGNHPDTAPPLSYRSGLLRFRSYRFHPYYRTQARMSVLSPTVSHRIDVNKLLCRFDLHGTCNDDKCPWQHASDYSLSSEDQLLDLACYSPAMADVPPKASTTQAMARLGSFVSDFQKKNQVISHDKQCLLLSSQVSYAADKVVPHLMFLEGRRYRLPQQRRVGDMTRDDGALILPPQREPVELVYDDNTLSESDIRYWMLSDVEVQDMETGVLENPHDIQLWFKLAGKRLQDHGGRSQGLEQALHTLSRALESNRDSEELWLYYLRLYEQHKSPDLLDLCQQALHFAPSYQLHWRYIHLLRSSSLKDTAAEQLCAWLCETGRPGSERHSHYLLEVLLYQVALHVSCGRYRSALTVFGTALRDEGPSAISSHLTAQDLCIAWLAYIHLTECRFLPPSMYDLSNANPGRINSKAAFLLPLEGKSRTSMSVLRQLLREAITAVCQREETLRQQKIQASTTELTRPVAEKHQETCAKDSVDTQQRMDCDSPILVTHTSPLRKQIDLVAVEDVQKDALAECPSSVAGSAETAATELHPTEQQLLVPEGSPSMDIQTTVQEHGSTRASPVEEHGSTRASPVEEGEEKMECNNAVPGQTIPADGDALDNKSNLDINDTSRTPGSNPTGPLSCEEAVSSVTDTRTPDSPDAQHVSSSGDLVTSNTHQGAQGESNESPSVDCPAEVSGPSTSLTPIVTEIVVPMVEVKCEKSEDLPAIAVAVPLYRNWAHLEAKNSNHAAALDICEEVLKAYPGCVEVWLQMADMEGKQAPEKAVKVLDAGIDACPLSAPLYRALSLAHLAQGDEDGALQHLEDAALCFFQNPPEGPLPDPNYLYCHLLGQPVPLSFQCPTLLVTQKYIDQQQPFIWTNYCLLVEIQGSSSEAADIFETALALVRDTGHIHAIWRSYLQHQIQLLHSPGSSVSLAAVVELVRRALLTVPSRVPLPYSNSRCWVDYTSHCDLLTILTDSLPTQQTALLYENLVPQMPNNVVLIQRCCELALSEGHRSKARGVSAAAVNDNPRCLTLWKIHLALMHRDSVYTEVQKLYRRALHHLPYALTLWKDYLAYEMVKGTPAGAKRIVERCHQLNLNINDFLNGLKRASSNKPLPKPQPGHTPEPVAGPKHDRLLGAHSLGRNTSRFPISMRTTTTLAIDQSSHREARASKATSPHGQSSQHGARSSKATFPGHRSGGPPNQPHDNPPDQRHGGLPDQRRGGPSDQRYGGPRDQHRAGPPDQHRGSPSDQHRPDPAEQRRGTPAQRRGATPRQRRGSRHGKKPKPIAVRITTSQTQPSRQITFGPR